MPGCVFSWFEWLLSHFVLVFLYFVDGCLARRLSIQWYRLTLLMSANRGIAADGDSGVCRGLQIASHKCKYQNRKIVYYNNCYFVILYL